MIKPHKWKKGDVRSIEHTFTASDVSRFAALTGDDNPVHVSNDYARNTPAGGAIVHGMLAASYISTLIGKEIPGEGAVWSSFDVTWKNPIRINDTVIFEAKVESVTSSTDMLSLIIEGTNVTKNNVCVEARAKIFCMQSIKKNEESVVSYQNLRGKRILIVGASGVIGTEISRQLSASGAQLILWGRDRSKLESLDGERHEVDLLDFNSLSGAIKKLRASQKLDGFVHLTSACVSNISIDDELNCEELKKHMELGPYTFSKLCSNLLPHMSATASLVAVLTQYVIGAPPPKTSAYVAAKMALLGLVKSVAVEMGPKGIRCNAVSPGMVNTPFSENISIKEKQIQAAVNPLRRLCTPIEIADAVCFLLGSSASFVNGVNLPLTGGVEIL
jgi:3-oxoacyl-[acyl-carrier protein] reductase